MKKLIFLSILISLFLINCSLVLSIRSREPIHKTFGYIVQFKEKPILEKKLEIEKNIKDLGTKGGKYKKQAETLQAGLSQDLAMQEDIISLEHQSFLSSATTVVPDIDRKILGEYKKVFNGIALDISVTELKEIKKLGQVKEIYPNYEVNATLMDSAPLINADDVWALGYTGEGVTIAILDTGIDYTHPDLGGCFGSECRVVDGYDFFNDDNDPMDDAGHGTHCAGIAAGNGALKGVAPDAKLYAYKVLGSCGCGNMGQIISGIERAVDPNQDDDYSDHVDVISMSLGGYGNPDDAVSQAVDTAFENGVIVVVAAGNSGPYYETILSPACARKALTVGATYKQDYTSFEWECTKTGSTSCGYCSSIGQILTCDYWGDGNPTVDQIGIFSSRGPINWGGLTLFKPDLVAPGAIICSARYDDVYPVGEHPYYYPCVDEEHFQVAGTSMAAPHIAGAVALLKQAHPDWTLTEIELALRNTAVDLGYDMNTQGYGRIDVLESVQLTNPPPVSVLYNFPGPIKGIVDIKGVATSDNFQSYSVYYGEGYYPTVWNLIGTGTTPVTGESGDDVLISWDTDGLEGSYTIRLVVDDNFGYSSEDNIIVTIDQYTQMGWPKYVYAFVGPPAVGDIDNDGYNEVLIAGNGIGVGGIDYALNVYAWNHDGTIMQGWPMDIFANGGFWDTPALADIDGDGDLEIFYGDFSGFYAWHHDGTLVDGWPVDTEPIAKTVTSFSDPVVEDIDGDGDLEIFFNPTVHFPGDYLGHTLYAFHHDGSLVSGWPIDLGNFLKAHPSVGRSNGEIVIVAHVIEDELNDLIYLLDSNGNVMPGWPKWIKNYNAWNDQHSVLVDLDDDGDLEVVAASTEDEYGFDTGDVSYVYAWHHDGSLVSGWPITIEQYLFPAPSVGDLDGDGDIEILIEGNTFISYAGYVYEGNVYAFHHDGSPVNGWPVGIGQGYEHHFNAPPVLGDIDGDGDTEAVVACINGYIYAWHHDGSPVNGWPKDIGIYAEYTPTIIDLDNDGDVEVIAVSDYFALNYGWIYIWDLPGTYEPTKMEWPMFQHDKRHTGLYFRCNTDRSGTDGVCHEECGADIKCDVRVPGSWCDGDVRKTCSTCRYKERDCKDIGLDYYCAGGTCTKESNGGGGGGETPMFDVIGLLDVLGQPFVIITTLAIIVVIFGFLTLVAKRR